MTKFLQPPSESVTRSSHVGTRHDSNRGTNDEVIECTVHFVDVFNYTFDAATTGDISIKGVPFPEIQLDRSGRIRFPSCGDRVLVKLGTGNTPIYVGHATQIEHLDDNARPTFKFTDLPRDHQYLRTPRMPGDQEWFARGGAFLSLLRGGMLKFGVSPLCQFVMGKWENFARMIVQNWEFFSCGLNAYSINHDGKITTRFSFFRKDTYGQNFHIKPTEWSARSDYDLMVDESGMNFLGGEVDPAIIELGGFIRKNRIKIFINPNGELIISQGLIPEENSFRQEIILGKYGKYFKHSMWTKSKKNVYEQQVQVNDSEQCTSLLKMIGTHEVNVQGPIAAVSDTSIKLDAPLIDLGSVEKASIVTVNGVAFKGNVPIHSWQG